MNRLLSSLLLAGSVLCSANLLSTLSSLPVVAETQTTATPNLFYLYKGQQIPLTVRPNTIAVRFKPNLAGTRRLTATQPLYQRLQTSLQSGTRDLDTTVQTAPIGTDHAIVTVRSASRDANSQVQQRIQQQTYVETALPVLTRSGSQDTLILPNEIIVSFAPNLSATQQQTILKAQNLAVIRPLRFVQNRFLVRSATVTGIQVLAEVNRLTQVSGITAASPNFIQVLSPDRAQILPSGTSQTLLPISLIGSRRIPTPTSNGADLSSLQWHLDSRSRRPNQPRTDLRIPEAWATSTRGQGVVVAVLDNLIQWDHPNLKESVLDTSTAPDRLPNEVNGWDFVQDDPDTRISPAELSQLLPSFQLSFQPDNTLLKQFSSQVKALRQRYPKASDQAILSVIREDLQDTSVSSFHGTMVSGVIAARAVDRKGIVGVAPNAKILPVRVGMLGRAIQYDQVGEAIRYAAHRGADVINMSFGGLTPTPEIESAIFDALQANPKLVVVVASGNEALDRPGFPALVTGTLAVGATNLTGDRAPYSNYGNGLDLVAPGGDTSQGDEGGVLTATGIGTGGFWQGIPVPKSPWGSMEDAQGNYIWTQGTSFSAPAVAGVVALMKGEDPQRKLSRDRLIALLKSTAHYDGLQISAADQKLYTFLRAKTKLSLTGNPQQYFFGSGLVDAAAAVAAVQRSR